MRTRYANLIRTYDGKRTLYKAAQGLETATIRTDLTYGHRHGCWNGSPVWEIHSEPGKSPPDVVALTEPVERDITNPVPLLFAEAKRSIADSWIPEAFHLVFHSSGWDSRIISGAIKELLKENGPDWLGEGLLFLCNRWESVRFLRIMEAMGWPADQYAVYQEGAADEHFAEHAYDSWRSGPFPRPGNFFWYLQDWAEKEGLMPSGNVQAFTGLWANEIWWSFVRDPNHWLTRVRRSYGVHMIASMPIKAQWEEYPLVSIPTLGILRKSKGIKHGNVLRREVGLFACPEAKQIKRTRAGDGGHLLSERLRHELDEYYQQTEWGKRVEWEVPECSGNSLYWGRWSSALLIDKLMAGGMKCEWPK